MFFFYYVMLYYLYMYMYTYMHEYDHEDLLLVGDFNLAIFAWASNGLLIGIP